MPNEITKKDRDYQKRLLTNYQNQFGYNGYPLINRMRQLTIAINGFLKVHPGTSDSESLFSSDIMHIESELYNHLQVYFPLPTVIKMELCKYCSVMFKAYHQCLKNKYAKRYYKYRILELMKRC